MDSGLEGTPSVLSVRGLLENYNAVDFFALLDGGFLQSPPDGVELLTKTFSNNLWLLKKEIAAGGSGTVSSREVEVFKLVTVQQVEGLDLDVLAYRRLTGETIVNGIPVASSQTVKAGVSTPLDITLAGSDPDGDPLTFIVVTQPEFGSVSDVSGTPPQVTYTPPAFEVSDSFAYKVFDGISDSAPAVVSIDVASGGAAGGTPASFLDVAPSNKIDDPLDAAMLAAPEIPFRAIVIMTRTLSQAELDALGPDIGLLGPLPVEFDLPAIPAIVVDLKLSNMLQLAEQIFVVRIEADPPLEIK